MVFLISFKIKLSFKKKSQCIWTCKTNPKVKNFFKWLLEKWIFLEIFPFNSYNALIPANRKTLLNIGGVEERVMSQSKIRAPTPYQTKTDPTCYCTFKYTLIDSTESSDNMSHLSESPYTRSHCTLDFCCFPLSHFSFLA